MKKLVLMICFIILVVHVPVSFATSHGFLWDNGTMIDLVSLPGPYSYAMDINNSGQIVGWSGGDSSLGTVRVALWDTSGQITNLGSPSGWNAGGYAINNLGQIAGTDSGGFGGFMWTQAIGFQRTGGAYAWGINDSGQVVGETSPGLAHAYMWSAATGIIDIGTLGGNVSRADAINNEGVVVGQSAMPTGENHAFKWTIQDGITDLGVFSLGATGFNISAINDLNQIVGTAYYSPSEAHAFRWSESGGLQDLNDLLPVHSGWVLKGAYNINNLGQIVGRGIYHNRDMGFIWENGSISGLDIGPKGVVNPFGINDLGQVVGTISYWEVPEPATMLLLGSGLIGLWGFRKKVFKK